nr:TatD family hydrolase [Candidatus Sigynarchaeota archaeon]
MIVDVHCHIDLYLDIDDVINRAKQANVAAVVAASMDPNSMEAILKLSSRFPDFVHPCLGLHPDSSKKITEKDLERALNLIRRSSEDLVAIGEIGLDHYFVK